MEEIEYNQEDPKTIKRDFKGIWIPKEVWLDDNLSVIEKVLYAEINSLDKGEKGCFASNKYFSKFFKIHEVNISKHISNLIKTGWVECVGNDGRKRYLKIKRKCIS